MVYRTVGQMIELEAIMLLIPMLAALIYGEMNVVPAFLIPAVCAGVIGFVIAHTVPPRALCFQERGAVGVCRYCACRERTYLL